MEETTWSAQRAAARAWLDARAEADRARVAEIFETPEADLDEFFLGDRRLRWFGADAAAHLGFAKHYGAELARRLSGASANERERLGLALGETVGSISDKGHVALIEALLSSPSTDPDAREKREHFLRGVKPGFARWVENVDRHRAAWSSNQSRVYDNPAYAYDPNEPGREGEQSGAPRLLISKRGNDVLSSLVHYLPLQALRVRASSPAAAFLALHNVKPFDDPVFSEAFPDGAFDGFDLYLPAAKLGACPGRPGAADRFLALIERDAQGMLDGAPGAPKRVEPRDVLDALLGAGLVIDSRGAAGANDRLLSAGEAGIDPRALAAELAKPWAGVALAPAGPPAAPELLAWEARAERGDWAAMRDSLGSGWAPDPADWIRAARTMGLLHRADALGALLEACPEEHREAAASGAVALCLGPTQYFEREALATAQAASPHCRLDRPGPRGVELAELARASLGSDSATAAWLQSAGFAEREREAIGLAAGGGDPPAERPRSRGSRL